MASRNSFIYTNIQNVSGLVQVQRVFQILGAATLKLRVPSDVETNGAERRLVLESLENE